MVVSLIPVVYYIVLFYLQWNSRNVHTCTHVVVIVGLHKEELDCNVSA